MHSEANDTDMIARKRIAASAKRILHEQALNQPTDAAYAKYIEEKYLSKHSAAAAAASSTSSSIQPPPQSIATDAKLEQGDQRIVFEPLNEASSRRKIPRADGYDPRHPDEGRYGPSWKSEEDRRHHLLQSHPHYRFLLLMAGEAGLNISRLVNVESMEQRATAADVRRRYVQLQEKLTLHDSQAVEEALRKLERERNELTNGEEDVRFLDSQIERQRKLEVAIEMGITNLSATQRLQTRYERLAQLFRDWVDNVYVPIYVTPRPQLTGDQRAQAKVNFHAAWTARVHSQFNVADVALLTDFVFGMDLGDLATVVLAALEPLYTYLKTNYKSATSNDLSLPHDVLWTYGPRLVELLREYALKSYDNTARFDTYAHQVSASDMPKFEFNKGILYELDNPRRLRNLRTRLENDLNAVEPSSDEARAIQARIDEVARQSDDLQGIVIDVHTLSNIERVIDLLRQSQQRSLEDTYFEEFLHIFGAVGAPDYNSPELSAHITFLRNKQVELVQRNKQSETQLEELERKRARLQLLKSRITEVNKDLIERRREVENAKRELQSMDTRFYQHNYEYVSRPENSGTLDLDSDAITALSNARRMAGKAMGRPDIELDTLMTDRRYYELFAKLAGLLRKNYGMTGGKAFVQNTLIERTDDAIDVLLTEEFPRLGRFGSSISVPSVTTSAPPIWQALHQAQVQVAAMSVRPTGFNPSYLVNRDGSSAFVPIRRNMQF